MKNPAAVALGSIRSERKANSSRKNGLDQRPHFKKCRHFESVYPYPLENNEWKVKFETGEITKRGTKATYNPDYYCKTTGYYIEVATSLPNIAEQGWKWSRVLARGEKLKVFWWEGNEITKDFVPKKLVHTPPTKEITSMKQ